MTLGDAVEAIRDQARLFDVALHAVIATTTAGTIVYWSDAAVQLYGWPRSHVLGRNIVDITPANSSQEHGREIMERLSKGQSWSGQFRVQHQDGSEFLAQVTDVPVHDASGELVGIVGISTLAK